MPRGRALRQQAGRTMDATTTTRAPAPIACLDHQAQRHLSCFADQALEYGDLHGNDTMRRPQGVAHQLRMRAAFTAHLVPDSADGQPVVGGAEQTPELGTVLMVDEGATLFAGRAKGQCNSLLAGPPLNLP
jgi:hypothetical protein